MPFAYPPLRASQGFTLVEIIFVILIFAVLTALVVPSFSSGIRQANFEKKVNEVARLFEHARSQAIASEIEFDQANQTLNNKIPTGGYGVFLDQSAQEVILFQDDWNNNAKVSGGAKVQFDYGNAQDLVSPDHKFTKESDTILKTLKINQPEYLTLHKITAQTLEGSAQALDQIVVIFLPLLETVLITNLEKTTEFQNFRAEFLFPKTNTLNSVRTLEFNRITTTPNILK